MKKLHLLLGILSVAVISCSKDESSGTPETPPLNTVPATFSQKVMIEEFSGAGQSQCPDGFVKIDNIIAANPATAIPVTIHYSDAMEIAQYTTLYTNFSNGSPAMFPSGMINRTPSVGNVILNRTQWQSNYDVAKAKTASCGLSIISSISGNTATIEVHAGFNQVMTGNYTLNVYLLENNVKGSGSTYDQRNSYNATIGHPYYATGDPILNFNHNYVLRKVISSSMGDAISSSALTAGGVEVKTYTGTINGYKAADLYVVAFISKAGTTSTTQEIMNVQRVKLGNTQVWD